MYDSITPKAVAFFTLLICLSQKARSQQIVFDPLAVASIESYSQMSKNELSAIDASEQNQTALQVLVYGELNDIGETEHKIYSALYAISDVVKDALLLKKCLSTADDILTMEKEALSYGVKYPILLLSVNEMQQQCATRITETALEISAAVNGSETNLMDNAERLNILRNILDELRVLRGICSRSLSGIRWAASGGWLRSFYQVEINHSRDKEILKDTQNDIKRLFTP